MSKPNDLAVRSVVGAGLIALAVAALWAGGVAVWLLAVVAALVMMAEWAGLAHADARSRKVALFAVSVPLAILAPMAAGPGFFALGLIAGAAFFVVIVTRGAMLAAGVAYVAVPVMAVLVLRGQPDGLLLAFWTLGLVWACDIGAYFSGRTFGGPKLAPAISPNKTWAGLIGGVIGATLFALVLNQTLALPVALVAATPVLAVLAVLGDLYESSLKRRAGVKDSGSMLPGHGGVLDRLDGLVPVAPIAALIVLLTAAA